MVWHDIEPCYVFHPMNAYDEADGDGVVVDVVRHPVHVPDQAPRPDEGAPTLGALAPRRPRGAVKEERLDDRGQEFPRVDERRVGLPHRYGYRVAVGESDDILGTETRLLRHDFEKGTSVARSFGRGRATWARRSSCPPPPVPTKADGWLLLLVYSSDTGDLGAAHPRRRTTLTGGPRPVVHLPRHVPAGFHGNWVPDPA